MVKLSVVVLAGVLASCTVCSREAQPHIKRKHPVKASIYAHLFDGRLTASGSVYSPLKLTAAHRSLPFGTRLFLRNVANGRHVIVTITDRGPFNDRYTFDLSPAAARRLGFTFKEGWAAVTYTVLGEHHVKESGLHRRKGVARYKILP